MVSSIQFLPIKVRDCFPLDCDHDPTFQQTSFVNTGPKVGCPVGYFLIGDYCYYHENVRSVTFEEAKKYCEKRHSELAQVHTSEQNYVLSAFFDEVGYNDPWELDQKDTINLIFNAHL